MPVVQELFVHVIALVAEPNSCFDEHRDQPEPDITAIMTREWGERSALQFLPLTILSGPYP
jgi:hypothetical protein